MSIFTKIFRFRNHLNAILKRKNLSRYYRRVDTRRRSCSRKMLRQVRPQLQMGLRPGKFVQDVPPSRPWYGLCPSRNLQPMPQRIIPWGPRQFSNGSIKHLKLADIPGQNRSMSQSMNFLANYTDMQVKYTFLSPKWRCRAYPVGVQLFLLVHYLG